MLTPCDGDGAKDYPPIVTKSMLMPKSDRHDVGFVQIELGLRLPGTVNLLGASHDGSRSGRFARGYAAAATPVTSAQTCMALVRAARYWAAGRCGGGAERGC